MAYIYGDANAMLLMMIHLGIRQLQMGLVAVMQQKPTFLQKTVNRERRRGIVQVMGCFINEYEIDKVHANKRPMSGFLTLVRTLKAYRLLPGSTLSSTNLIRATPPPSVERLSYNDERSETSSARNRSAAYHDWDSRSEMLGALERTGCNDKRWQQSI